MADDYLVLTTNPAFYAFFSSMLYSREDTDQTTSTSSSSSSSSSSSHPGLPLSTPAVTSHRGVQARHLLSDWGLSINPAKVSAFAAFPESILTEATLSQWIQTPPAPQPFSPRKTSTSKNPERKPLTRKEKKEKRKKEKPIHTTLASPSPYYIRWCGFAINGKTLEWTRSKDAITRTSLNKFFLPLLYFHCFIVN